MPGVSSAERLAMRALAISLLVLLTAGCTGLTARPQAAPPEPFAVRPTDSPFVRVTAGAVSGLVPDRWEASALLTGARMGFMASPHPNRFAAEGLPAAGLAVTWVDATAVGVPSDYYYLAATAPTGATPMYDPDCEAERTAVFIDHSPAYLDGHLGSPGDFVAQAAGSCGAGTAQARRWSSFVAAPGFGPARELGIPASGLYVVTAVTRDTPGARARLAHLLRNVRFGNTAIGDFVRAVGVPA